MTFSKAFIKAAAIRAIKTGAQVALAMFTVGQTFSSINWIQLLSVTGVAVIYSLLTSIAGGLPETKTNGTLIIDKTPESKDVFRFELDKPLGDLESGDIFTLDVEEE